MAITMFRPLLIDLGLSTAQIGLLLGVVSYGVGTIGALVGGAIAGGFSGTIADRFGYSGLFILCVGLTLGNLLLISRLKV